MVSCILRQDFQCKQRPTINFSILNCYRDALAMLLRPHFYVLTKLVKYTTRQNINADFFTWKCDSLAKQKRENFVGIFQRRSPCFEKLSWLKTCSKLEIGFDLWKTVTNILQPNVLNSENYD